MRRGLNSKRLGRFGYVWYGSNVEYDENRRHVWFGFSITSIGEFEWLFTR
jgi:hypothetical protein